jgi:hypothetical protein
VFLVACGAGLTLGGCLLPGQGAESGTVKNPSGEREDVPRYDQRLQRAVEIKASKQLREAGHSLPARRGDRTGHHPPHDRP